MKSWSKLQKQHQWKTSKKYIIFGVEKNADT